MPAKLGRPPIPKTERRGFKVLVALNAAEAKAIRAAAGGQPLAVWFRELGLRAAKRRGSRG
jgi:hypothetical protein